MPISISTRFPMSMPPGTELRIVVPHGEAATVGYEGLSWLHSETPENREEWRDTRVWYLGDFQHNRRIAPHDRVGLITEDRVHDFCLCLVDRDSGNSFDQSVHPTANSLASQEIHRCMRLIPDLDSRQSPPDMPSYSDEAVSWAAHLFYRLLGIIMDDHAQALDFPLEWNGPYDVHLLEKMAAAKHKVANYGVIWLREDCLEIVGDGVAKLGAGRISDPQFMYAKKSDVEALDGPRQVRRHMEVFDAVVDMIMALPASPVSTAVLRRAKQLFQKQQYYKKYIAGEGVGAKPAKLPSDLILERGYVTATD